MRSLTDTFILRNGVEIPCVGFGTWKTPDGEIAVRAVSEALRAGYRHIDTAALYGNEASVGAAIRESRLDRRELFVTSKLWNTERGYDKAMAAFEQSMDKLGLETLDLYLLHWPATKKHYDNPDAVNLSSWKALTELYKAGRIRAIGVSNFLPHHMEPLMQTEIPPMVNQIEVHPGYGQEETIAYCRQNGVLVEAWSPLARGRVLADGTLTAIAARYHRSTAQICLKWCLQNGVLPLPKSVTEARIRENAALFDFTLSAEDMATLNALPQTGFSGHNPDDMDF